jgi:hypothetical protein
VEVAGATTLALTGAIGPAAGAVGGPLVKAGPGLLVLNNPANAYPGGVTVNASRLDVGDDAQLGVAAVAVNPAGTPRYAASTATARAFNLYFGTLEVPAGVALTLNGAAVNAGFLVGAGTFATSAGGATTFFGDSTTTSTTIVLNGSDGLTNFSQGGQLTVAAGRMAALARFTNTASGRVTVNGTANVSDFVNYGVVAVNPGAAVNNAGGDLTVGGGGVLNVGVYNPSNSQVTRGGTVSLGDTNLVVRGGLVRNNGTITSNNGNVVVDFGGVLRGAGTFDVNAVVLQNGGVRLSGNSPGLSANRTLDLTDGGVTASDGEQRLRHARLGRPGRVQRLGRLRVRGDEHE